MAQLQQVRMLVLESLANSESVQAGLQKADDELSDWKNETLALPHISADGLTGWFDLIGPAIAKVQHKQTRQVQPPPSVVSQLMLIIGALIIGAGVLALAFALIFLGHSLRIRRALSLGFDLIVADAGYFFGVSAVFLELGLHP